MKANHLKAMPAKKRTLLLVVSLCLVVTLTVSGTFAYMWFKAANSANNTFKGTDLTLSFGNGSDSQQIVPGEYFAIPNVTVKANSVKSYLFVRIYVTNSASRDYYLNITPNSSYQFQRYNDNTTTQNDMYFYVEVPDTTSDITYNAFQDNRISIKTNVTKEQIASVDDFTVNIQYCAVQQDNLTLDQAFAECSWN